MLQYLGSVILKWRVTNRYCCRGGIHCSSCPEPLMIKDKKVKVNKLKPNVACPARLMLIVIKCPLIQRQAALVAIPMLYAAFFLNCFALFGIVPLYIIWKVFKWIKIFLVVYCGYIFKVKVSHFNYGVIFT